MMTVCHPHLPILSIWVLVLLNGIHCQDNEGACQSGTQCKPTVHTFMEDTARNVLKNEILPEHTSKLDRMFDDKFATVKSRLESHFNEFGRKQGIFLTQSLSIIGAILSGISKPASTYEIFIIGQLFIGVACGLLTGATSVM